MKIRTRLEYFLAKLAGREVDFKDIIGPNISNTEEELLTEISDKIGGGNGASFVTLVDHGTRYGRLCMFRNDGVEGVTLGLEYGNIIGVAYDKHIITGDDGNEITLVDVQVSGVATVDCVSSSDLHQGTGVSLGSDGEGRFVQSGYGKEYTVFKYDDDKQKITVLL